MAPMKASYAYATTVVGILLVLSTQTAALTPVPTPLPTVHPFPTLTFPIGICPPDIAVLISRCLCYALAKGKLKVRKQPAVISSCKSYLGVTEFSKFAAYCIPWKRKRGTGTLKVRELVADVNRLLFRICKDSSPFLPLRRKK